MERSTSIGRREFVVQSAAFAGLTATGLFGQEPAKKPTGTTDAKKPTGTTDAKKPTVTTDAYVRISGKNHFIRVQAWMSDAVLGATKSSGEGQAKAIVARLLHENEKFLDVVTHGGQHVGPIRLYVDMPHKESSDNNSMVHAATSETSANGCFHNQICCEWAATGKECCVCWSCCDLT